MEHTFFVVPNNIGVEAVEGDLGRNYAVLLRVPEIREEVRTDALGVLEAVRGGHL
jgi:hypothetical protein